MEEGDTGGRPGVDWGSMRCRVRIGECCGYSLMSRLRPQLHTVSYK